MSRTVKFIVVIVLAGLSLAARCSMAPVYQQRANTNLDIKLDPTTQSAQLRVDFVAESIWLATESGYEWTIVSSSVPILHSGSGGTSGLGGETSSGGSVNAGIAGAAGHGGVASLGGGPSASGGLSGTGGYFEYPLEYFEYDEYCGDNYTPCYRARGPLRPEGDSFVFEIKRTNPSAPLSTNITVEVGVWTEEADRPPARIAVRAEQLP